MNPMRLAAVSAAALLLLAAGTSYSKIGLQDIEYQPKGAGKVIFRHQYHVELKGMRCNRCHYAVFQMTQGSYKMNMKTLTKGQFCGLCHNGKDGFGLALTKNCNRCHQP